MAKRLGEVLYWAACGIAVLYVLAAFAYLLWMPFIAVTFGWNELITVGSLAAYALGIWLIGRVIRYMLAGR